MMPLDSSEQLYQELTHHVPFSRETYGRLVLYHDLLLKWQEKINLIGPDTIQDIWQRHMVDSLQLYKLIEDPGHTIMDIGTGAGFPGMVLAIMGMQKIHLVESDLRKVIFLREVARVTQTPVTIHLARVESLPLMNVDYILSRACSSLATLLSLASSFISHETICLFHKGKNYSMEIADAEKQWEFTSHIFPSVVTNQSVILKLTHIRNRGYDAKRKEKPAKPS